MSSSFVHLHLHSSYSLLDGANRIDDVVAAAAEAEMPAMALTDHGNMFGAIDFYRKARRQGVKPILGIEAYVAQGSRVDRDPARGRSNHLVLLARDETGYRNLLKLTSRSYLEGFYYKPRIDHELLRDNAEGLVGLSACLKGEVTEMVVQGRERDAERRAAEYREILGDGNFFLELQDHGIEDQRLANDVLRRISARTGIPLVATNDCHYLRSDDAFAHDVLLCVGTQRALTDTNRMRYASDQFYLKTADEMFALFPRDAQAIENTLRIAEMCDLELPEGSFHLPEFPVPDGTTLDDYFEQVAWAGLSERLERVAQRGEAPPHPKAAYEERLRHEIAVIRRMGFAGYFLITWDFIRHARERQIPVGPGRGSAAGSLVAYSLRITDIDPLRYDLLFERFLNPERVSMPDIDIDFCMRRRGEVIQYVNEKYGRDKVAQIITFGTLAAKAVIRDVGRVMGMPYSKVDRIAKMVPDMTKSLAEAAKEVDALAQEVRTDEEVRRIVEVGSRLEGAPRHASLHAAGVVITPEPTEQLVPLYKTSKGEIVTQWDKDVIESLGLLKMDFLGLRTLTVIDDTLRTLEHQGRPLDLDRVPLDDEKTFELFSEAKTSGIFQFESSGMKDLLRRANPDKFEDLAAMNALYRPGALSVGMVEEYILRKLGKRRIRFILPETEPILDETYGVIVYQEQVMQIAVEVAGFSMGEADVLRKAMGKKSPEVMAKQKVKFLDAAEGRGFDRAKAQELWDYIEPFAGYGFNKSHSVAYAMLAYKTAYLKAHYPVAFMAAMLTSEINTKDNVAKYVGECREMGIEVLPPDVNESAWAFTVAGDAIRLGLGAVKGIGEGAVEAVLEARRRVGRFRSLAHFALEVDLRALNHKVFECLIRSGSCDSFGFRRGALMASLDRIHEYAVQRQRDEERGQTSLFGGGALAEPEVDAEGPRWPERERLRYEKETLGFYLTGNPLEEFKDQLARLADQTTGSLRLLEEEAGAASVGGIVTRLVKAKIKSGPNAGRLMARFMLEDLEGAVPVAAFADAFQRWGHLLEEEAIVIVKGSVRPRGSGVEMTLEGLEALEEARTSLLTALELRLGQRITSRELLRLRELLMENPGPVPVTFEVELERQRVRVRAEDRFGVRYAPDLVASIEEILGHGCTKQRFATS